MVEQGAKACDAVQRGPGRADDASMNISRAKSMAASCKASLVLKSVWTPALLRPVAGVLRSVRPDLEYLNVSEIGATTAQTLENRAGRHGDRGGQKAGQVPGTHHNGVIVLPDPDE
jgi:hypothetical protein